jgi:bifunctional UDP-N-acetylglucosamine pyrophosphorylase/glucosamine-1-phosphate N-acetyltransferase
MGTPAVIVLAAGKGTRMKSRLPKVLHEVAGLPIIGHVMAEVRETGFGPVVVVVGHGADGVRAAIGDDVAFAPQEQQLGTGHAVRVALDALPYVDNVLVVYGECPLVQASTLRAIWERHESTGAVETIVTGISSDPTGIGRIIRDSAGRVRAIVEEAVATPEEKAIREINGGFCAFRVDFLRRYLSSLPLRPKGEYYLTDMLEAAVAAGLRVESVEADAVEIVGVNDRTHLALAESVMRRRIRTRHMLDGVTIVDPESTYIERGVRIGADTVVRPNTHLQGATIIGSDCELGPNTQIADSRIGDGCRVWASVIEASVVDPGVSIGPMSRLRPGVHVETGTYVGNYAELKNSRVGPNCHIAHFSYVGDADVGSNVNIGAGTVTCNFNTEKGVKSRTVLADDASVGSDTMLVAPVRVGAGAITGAGSVVTEDVPDGYVVMGVPARRIRPVRRGPVAAGEPRPPPATARPGVRRESVPDTTLSVE